MLPVDRLEFQLELEVVIPANQYVSLIEREAYQYGVIRNAYTEALRQSFALHLNMYTCELTCMCYVRTQSMSCVNYLLWVIGSRSEFCEQKNVGYGVQTNKLYEPSYVRYIH